MKRHIFIKFGIINRAVQFISCFNEKSRKKREIVKALSCELFPFGVLPLNAKNHFSVAVITCTNALAMYVVNCF